MRREARLDWVCDRCGLTINEPAGTSGPTGWRALAFPQVSRRNDMTGQSWYDICSPCDESFDEWWHAGLPVKGDGDA